MTTKTQFTPDYAIPPGATLKSILDERRISQADLATRTGLAEKTISQLINGVAPLTFETAEKLEMAIGVSAKFWNQRELKYREVLAQHENAERYAKDVDWLKGLPIAELKKRRLIAEDAEKASLVRSALKFFGVSSVDAWNNAWLNPLVQFRSHGAEARKPACVAAWLRMGDIQAEHVKTSAYDASKFKAALVRAKEISTSSISEWLKEISAACADAGVALILTKEIPGAGISGATRWVSKDRALLQLSLKFKTDDQFLFSFFHESGHILLHGKKQMFVEFGIDESTKEEREANAFARDFLIHPTAVNALRQLTTKAEVLAFARSLNIPPGVIVGRLQHDKLIRPSMFNDLKRKVTWSN